MLAELDECKVLIDLGVPASVLRSTLEHGGCGWSDIDAVLITHTHTDHVKGLDACRRRISAPFYMSGTTKDTLMLEDATALLYSVRTEVLPGLWVTAIPTSHDCPGSAGYKIETSRCAFGYLTDLGTIPESTMEILYGCDAIVIESNHDEEMLRYGKYPAFLKKYLRMHRTERKLQLSTRQEKPEDGSWGSAELSWWEPRS